MSVWTMVGSKGIILHHLSNTKRVGGVKATDSNYLDTPVPAKGESLAQPPPWLLCTYSLHLNLNPGRVSLLLLIKANTFYMKHCQRTLTYA